MKPSFDIPGCSKFFYEGSDEGENDSNIKISWFEENMDTFIAKRVVTKYQVYELRQQFPQKEPKPDEEKKCSDIAIAKKDSISFESKGDINKDFPDYLKKLFTLGNLTLNPSPPRHLINALHCCALPKQEDHVSSKHDLTESEDKYDKSSSEVSADSGEIVPLATLELFIKNAMDNSLAKFRDEINRAINCKFDSLKNLKVLDNSSKTILNNKQNENTVVSFTEEVVPSSIYSSDIVEGSVVHVSDQIQPPLQAPPEPETAPLEVQNVTSEHNTLASESQHDNVAVDEGCSENCTIFNLMQPEIKNLMIKKGCIKKFHSESINIISKSPIKPQIGSISDNTELDLNVNNSKGNSSSDNFTFSEKCQSLNILCNSTHPESILKDETNTVTAAAEPTTSCDSLKDSKCDTSHSIELTKKNNHKLLNDVSKFMFIIFESFRRLKDENNINLKKRKLSKCEIDNILCSMKNNGSALGSFTQPQEEGVAHTKGINNCINIPPPTFEHFFEEISTKIEDSPNKGPIDTPLEIAQSQPIIACVTPQDLVKGSENGGNMFHPTSYVSSDDTGYTIRRFIKDSNVSYKRSYDNSDLTSLKEEYLHNLISERENDNPKESEEEVDDCSDKYKCFIKKKFSYGRSVLRNKRDSKFYCNVTKPKDSANSRDSLVTFKDFCKKGRSNKESSNIIKLRNRLNKSKSRGVFKSSSKRSDVSLDSTIMNLLDIRAKNINSLFKENNSSIISPSQEEKADSGNLLKRLCFIKFVWNKKACVIFEEMDRHLINIYNAICLDFVSDDVYKSVIFVADHLRSSDNKTKSAILKHWIKICNRQHTKEKKGFKLEFIHQLWSQFLVKICHHARPSSMFPSGFCPALTYPSEENRFLKEQVIQKYAKDILEYISDPHLFKYNILTSE